MKNLLIIIISALLASASFANTASVSTVQVTGVGNTEEQARNDAFKKAIEFVVGTVLINNVEARNNKIVLNEILQYSSGYIQNFKVNNIVTNTNKVVIDMTVNVASSKIANRMLSEQYPGSFVDGEKIIVQRDSFLQSKNSADAILRNFFRSYPSKSFEIKNINSALTADTSRNIIFNIKLDVVWNQNWLQAFVDMLSLIEADHKAKTPYVIMFYDLQKNKWYNSKIDDHKFIDSIIRNFKDKFPTINVEFYSNNNLIHRSCFVTNLDELLNADTQYYGVRALKILPKNTESFNLNVHIPKDGSFSNVTDLKINFVENEICRK